MEYTVKIGILGAFAAAFDIVNIVFNIVFAFSISNKSTLSALKVLFFVAFGLNLVSLIALGYFAVFYSRKLGKRLISLTRSIWFAYIYGATVAVAAIVVTLVTMVWSVVRQDDLPKFVIGLHPMSAIGIWFGTWGVTTIFQLTIFVLLGLWTKQALKSHSISRMDLDFGIYMPPMEDARPNTSVTQRTFRSQSLTINSPPRTPTSRRPSTTARSSATRVAPSSGSKTRLVKGSARSSLDIPPFPAGEAMSIDSAFDDWDTSSVHQEMRVAVHSSPPTRSGLETIPGSRPESPANALDGPFLPSSPTLTSSSPHAASAQTAEAFGWEPTSPYRPYPSSPPQTSSPPNFSRPTSRPGSSEQQGRTLAPAFGAMAPDHDMQDLIHPLFRDTSPEPAPTAGPGTTVTASQRFNEPITPKSLAKLRGGKISHWKSMPSIDHSERPETAGSAANSIFGSPGPSIVDDEEEERNLSPALPGFVLSAGQRTSFIGYGKRKSVKKDRRHSQMSTGSRASRLSQLLMSTVD